jgi:uncharacterized membrane protein YbhN (UPF0104 family)
MKWLLPVLLKLAVSGGLLALVLRDLSFGDAVLPRLKLIAVNWGWTLAGLGCVALTIVLHTWRWSAGLVGQAVRVPFPRLLQVNLAAQLFNLSPLGTAGADAWRGWSLVRNGRLGRLPVVVSLVLDHLVGLASIAILSMVFIAAFARHWSQHSQAVQSIVSGFVGIMGLSLFLLLLSVWSFSPGLYSWGEQRLPWLLGNPRVKEFCQACDSLRSSWRCSLEALAVSVVMFVAHFLTFYCGARAVAEMPPVMDVLAAMPIVDGAAGLPISIAGLGVREKTFETLMGALSGMGEAAAVSASLAGWLMQVFWSIAGGLVFLSARSGGEHDDHI